jgi:hypothetical protein
MLQQQRGWMSRRLLPLVVGTLLVALVLPVRAQEKSAGALGLLPADAGFFSAMLRNKEQLDIIARSNAWGELWEMPIVQKGWQQLKKEYTSEDGNLSRLRSFMEEPENKEMLEFFADAGAQEIFAYGGANWLQFSELMGLVQRSSQIGSLAGLIENVGKPPDPKAQPRAMLRALAAHPELLGTPDLMFGFKLTDVKRAEKQLKRLEDIIIPLANITELLKDRIKRTKVDDDSFLTFNLDGGMVPWESIPINDLAEKEGEFDGVVKKLKELKLVISLGVKNDYFLIAFGSSADVVKQLGGRGKHLIDRAELKPVVEALDKPLTSISYTSAAVRAQGTLSDKDFESVLELARAGLGAAEIPEARRKQIVKDLEALVRELGKETATPGAEVGFSYLTKRGFETFDYDYTKESRYDDSKPLTLLDHLGSTPIFAALAREKPSPEEYATLVKWIKVFYGHADAVLKDKLTGDQKEMYQKITKEAIPLLERLDEITGKQLIPALADGQGGFVLDAKWTSKQWHKSAKLPMALPLPEIALVIGVSDEALLKKAAGGYREVFNEAMAKARELAPKGDMPEIKVAPAKTNKVKAGDADAELFWYPIPEDAGLDPQVAPTAGLTEKVLVLAPSNKLAERLLTPEPLKIEGGPLTRKKGVAAVVYLNWPALIDVAQPWVEAGLTIYAEDRAGGDDAPKPAAGNKEVLEQIRTGFRILKAFRGYSSATFREGDTWVTHGESVFRDLGTRDR